MFHLLFYDDSCYYVETWAQKKTVILSVVKPLKKILKSQEIKVK